MTFSRAELLNMSTFKNVYIIHKKLNQLEKLEAAKAA